MKTILTNVYREPAALLAFVTAVLAVLTWRGVLDETGAAVALGVVTAAIGALRYVVTPSSEVVAQRKPGAPSAVAGPAAKALDSGEPVVVRQLYGEHRAD